MKPKRRMISVLLAICLVVGLMPTAAFAAGTDQAIQLGTSGISGYDSTNGYDYIYYGTWDSSAIKWRVLDDQTNTGGSGLFLLSDVLLGTGSYGDVYFDNSGNDSNVWQSSSARAWCKDFAGEEGAATNVTNAFTANGLFSNKRKTPLLLKGTGHSKFWVERIPCTMWGGSSLGLSWAVWGQCCGDYQAAR